MHFGPICTLDQYALWNNIHFEPICTWDKYGLATNMVLRPICTWDHDGLGTSWDQITLNIDMQLSPEFEKNVIGYKTIFL